MLLYNTNIILMLVLVCIIYFIYTSLSVLKSIFKIISIILHRFKFVFLIYIMMTLFVLSMIYI